MKNTLLTAALLATFGASAATDPVTELTWETAVIVAECGLSLADGNDLEGTLGLNGNYGTDPVGIIYHDNSNLNSNTTLKFESVTTGEILPDTVSFDLNGDIRTLAEMEAGTTIIEGLLYDITATTTMTEYELTADVTHSVTAIVTSNCYDANSL